MTSNKAETIVLPNWVMKFAVVLIPIVLSFIVSFSTSRFADGKQSQKVDSHEQRIEKIEDNKVDKDVLTIFQDQLNRIEEKLDKHMEYRNTK